MRRAVAGIVVLVAALMWAGAAFVQDWWPPKPLPGYNIFNDQQEIWLGEVFAEELGIDNEVVDDPEAQAYLQQLGERLVLKSKRPELKYQFFLLDRRGVQASALPGGRVYVTKGMVEFCENEAELAAVLGHEVGHIALRQGAKTFSRWLFWGLGVSQVGDKEDIRRKDEQFHRHLAETGGFQIATDLMFGIMRADEVWADKYGIWNAHAAGYDPQAAVSVFRRFDAKEQEARGDPFEQDPFLLLLELLMSSHPQSGDRANLLELEIPWMKKNPKAVLDTEEFQRFKRRVAGEAEAAE